MAKVVRGTSGVLGVLVPLPFLCDEDKRTDRDVLFRFFCDIHVYPFVDRGQREVFHRSINHL